MADLENNLGKLAIEKNNLEIIYNNFLILYTNLVKLSKEYKIENKELCADKIIELIMELNDNEILERILIFLEEFINLERELLEVSEKIKSVYEENKDHYNYMLKTILEIHYLVLYKIEENKINTGGVPVILEIKDYLNLAKTQEEVAGIIK